MVEANNSCEQYTKEEQAANIQQKLDEVLFLGAELASQNPARVEFRSFTSPPPDSGTMGRLLHAFAKNVAPDRVTWKIAQAGFLKTTPLSFAGVDMDNLTENQRQIVTEANQMRDLSPSSSFAESVR